MEASSSNTLSGIIGHVEYTIRSMHALTDAIGEASIEANGTLQRIQELLSCLARESDLDQLNASRGRKRSVTQADDSRKLKRQVRTMEKKTARLDGKYEDSLGGKVSEG